MKRIGLITLFSALAAAPLPPAAAQDLLWTRQGGSILNDLGWGIAVDSAGSAYIVGWTNSSLGGPHAGSMDVFVARHDASGALLWTRQFGTAGDDAGTGLAVDRAGNVYMAGSTAGSLGGPSAGGDDAFLAKFDASGSRLWMRQFGTTEDDWGRDAAVDSAGNAYITGYTRGNLNGPNAGFGDYFLAKYDASGALLSMHQAGTTETDFATGVAVDSAGNAYITGYTWGSLGGRSAGSGDYFLAKFGEAPCDADCDTSTGNRVLDIFDFLCFQNEFVMGNSYACDCDTSTGVGVCDMLDFLCFQEAFVAGCP